MGGTLDGDGVHWLDRFVALYKNFGANLPREVIRDAFDEAERQSAVDENIASANLEEMIELHVKWQLARLGLNDQKLEQHLVQGLIEPVRKAAAENARLLATLVERGFELGVVSNGCGNVDRLCADFGYCPISQSSSIRAGWDSISRTRQSFATRRKNLVAILAR